MATQDQINEAVQQFQQELDSLARNASALFDRNSTEYWEATIGALPDIINRIPDDVAAELARRIASQR